MSPLLFANTSRLTLSDTLEGASFTWPKLVPGFDLCASLRLTKTIEGEVEIIRRTLDSLKVTVGEVDARPTAGAIMIKVGGDAESAGVNTTAAIAYNASAADVAAAFNALSGPTSLKPFTCVERFGSYILRAAAGAQTTLTVVDNDLWPSSRVDIREFAFDEGYSYELRLCQVPVAEVTTFNSVVPPVPTVTQVRAGADNSGVLTSEIQKIYVPPENPEGFAFALKKGYKRSEPITGLDIEAIQAAMDKIADADAGEEFKVYEADNGFLVEFLGDSWLGVNQDLLEVEVVNEARADTAFRLVTATNEMAVRMRNVPTNGEVKLPLEITLGLENEQNALLTDTVIFRAELTFVRPVSMARFSAAAAINWNTPLTRESYQQFSPSQVATGQRHYLISTAIGDGSTTVFNIDHNLGTRYVLVQLQESAADGEFLILGTDYDIEIVTDNRIKITFASAPASGAVLGQITSAAHDANFEPHTHDIDDITGLETRLAAAEEAVAELQGTAGVGSLGTKDTAVGNAILEIDLGNIAEVYPARKTLEELMSSQGSTGSTTTTTTTGTSQEPAAKRIADIPLGVLPKDSALLPAVHDATVDDLPDPLPAPGSANKGKVYVNAGSVDVTLPGGGGRKSSILKVGEHCASDGRYLYKVIRSGSTTSYFPADFEREFALVAINGDMLAVKRTLEFRLGLELAIVNKKTPVPQISDKQTRAQWKLKIEWGTRTSETSPSTPASNLKSIAWNSTPILTTTLDITTSPTIHTLGARIKRTAADAWAVEKSLYGLWTASAATINAAAFFLRAKFEEFDVEDIADPRGFVILLGTHVATGADSDSIGFLTIK